MDLIMKTHRIELRRHVRHAQTVMAWIAALSPFLSQATTQAADAYQARDLIVIPIQQVEVPATQSGRISEINIKPGDEVLRGEVIGSLDARQALLAVSLAENEFQIAQQVSDSNATANAAKSRLNGEKQAARQLIVTRDIAKIKAQNDLKVLAAKKSEAVAENEYRRATESRQQYVQSVSKSEIESLKLVVDKSRLESKQAELERQIAGLEVQAETESARRQASIIQQAEAEVSAAETEVAVAKLQRRHRKIQLELAKVKLDEHRIVAPLNGRVSKVFKSPGAWADTGEAIARIVHLDQLRIEGFAPIDQLNDFQLNASFEVTVQVSGNPLHRHGTLVFIDPEIDPVSNQFRYWIDFDNDDKSVLPGMRASIRMEL
jgi:multidrug efflux pump subunit AcrA (membrane-fusion protein)